MKKNAFTSFIGNAMELVLSVALVGGVAWLLFLSPPGFSDLRLYLGFPLIVGGVTFGTYDVAARLFGKGAVAILIGALGFFVGIFVLSLVVYRDTEPPVAPHSIHADEEPYCVGPPYEIC